VVEFALILPIMLILLAGAIDLGRAFYAYVAVENAAKEGALYGSRHPLCDSASSCPDHPTVTSIVEGEAANLLLTTQVACRTPAGTLVQSMNDCANGDQYVVTVTHRFRLVMPILGDLLASELTLGSTSQATVIEDAFDPSGLEVLVWVDKSDADNATDIAGSCRGADPLAAPGYYYAPCQDQANRFNYLEFQEGQSVRYKVRVRNTGNIDLTGLTYGFSVNGATITPPISCPKSLSRNSSPVSCGSFTRTVTAAKPIDGVADYIVEVGAQGLAAGLPTGPTNGSALVKVVPAPRLVVNLRAARYRLGDDGDGKGGSALYGSGDLTLDRSSDNSTDITVRNPTAWLKVSVVNQGGTARNFRLVVTRNGQTISLPSECSIPASLPAGGSPGDSFTCILPQTLTDTRDYDFRASATASNAQYGSGDPNVTITTQTCKGSTLVVPNLVDDLSPPDGSRRTVAQSRSLWSAAGFSGLFTTNPSGAGSSTPVLTQSVPAYTCESSGKGVQVGTR
jgi:hypothetical protein